MASRPPALVVQLAPGDADPRPLEYWAERWDTPITTIRGWISRGECPGRKVGGKWMISALDLIGHAPPTMDGKKTDGESEGRGDVRVSKRRKGPAPEKGGGSPSRWAV